MRRGNVIVVAAAVATGVLGTSLSSDVSTAAPRRPTVREQARQLLQSPAARYLSSSALWGISQLAETSPRFSAEPRSGEPGSDRGNVAAARSGVDEQRRASGLRNVLVNEPERDRAQPDQSTQSETAMAVHGKTVVVGFNDTQQALPYRPTAGASISGFAYSTNGGESFEDAGTIPNAPGSINLGDPWLASDRGGSFYYSTLMLGSAGTAVGVAVSHDGESFSAPVTVSPSAVEYEADKPAITVGPDPHLPARDNVYAAWNDFAIDDAAFTLTTGLPVAHSTDGGQTWQVAYAAKVNTDGCDLQQFIGAQPIVDGAGVLRVFAEKIVESCDGSAPPTFSEWVFTSRDGGQTFAPGRRISGVVPVARTGAVDVAPGQAIRTIEFPVVALVGTKIVVAWNDARRGSSDILLATSPDGGTTWTKSWATGGAGEDLQPAIAADAAGVHLAFYRVNLGQISLNVADSPDASTFTLRQVSDVTFPGVLTVPQFDPFTAQGYMGDYIALVSDGLRQYFAWGDNRNRVVSPLYPQGRNDPDVYFART